MNRGSDRQDVFLSDDDYRMFEWLIGNACRKFNMEVHGYCLMTNHFHLLAHCPSAGLSEAMHAIGSGYARWFNDRYSRDGPLFRGRFKSVLVADDDQLVQVSRYIHRNPLSFLALPELAAYRWSSLGVFLDRRTGPDWLVLGDVLAMFGHDRERLNAHVESDQPGDKQIPRSSPRPVHRTTLDDLDDAVAIEEGVDLPSLRVSRPGVHNRARLIAMTVAIERRIAAAEVIAEHYGLRSPQSARNLARRGRAFAARDDNVRRLQERILARLDRPA